MLVRVTETLWCALQMLQLVLAAACVAFAILWFRALSRVRANVAERSAAVRCIAATYTGLSSGRADVVLKRLVVLQAAVRRRRAVVLRRRLLAMAAYVRISSPCTRHAA